MAIQSGQTLLHYRLAGKIGEGGMGVVWKATDTDLDREVAIKVLPDAFAGDSDRLARFEREAKLLASLNHPNVATVYGVHKSEGTRFLAMELVPGVDLSEKLTAGRIPIDETLEIVRQIAEALEAAHDRGIVHRDLKPANVRIRPDETVKVLDFGLARAMTAHRLTESDPEAPTTPVEHTKPGLVLGTAPYMSPEQARGKPVDKRTDIWALGCILYECLTGTRAFDGETTTDILARVVSSEPDLGSIPTETPDFLVRLVQRCLEKDPRRRLRDAGEVRVAVEEFRSNPDSRMAGRKDRPGVRIPPVLVPWILVAALVLILVYSMSRGDSSSVDTVPAVSRWSIALPPASRVAAAVPGGTFDISRLVAISRDGSLVAYAVQDEFEQAELYLRETNAREPRPIPGTKNARAPFFSPDGQWVGFLADNTIQKVAIKGGSPQRVCSISTGRRSPPSFDASWSPDGESIVFSTDVGLWRVPATGGIPEQLTRPDEEKGEVGHLDPRVTPDGRGVIFSITVTPETHLAYLSLETREWDIIVRNASHGLQVEDWLVFARAGEMLAAEYDSRGHRLVGSPVSVQQGVHTTPGLGGFILSHFDVSGTGTLVYVPAPIGELFDELMWVDEAGNETVITRGAGTWVHPRLSPDGQRISVDIHSVDGVRDIYIYELPRDQLRRLTTSGQTWESEWSPDGERIATLSASPAGYWSLFWVRTDFSGPAELLLRSSHIIPGRWLPDEQALLLTEYVEGEIWKLSLGEDAEPERVMGTSAWERFPRLSPDGKWIAYVKDESGRREVFVQSFPDLGPEYRVSVNGGGEPVWAHDGRQIFFRERDEMLVVEIEYGPVFRASRPRVLFSGRYDGAMVGHQHYDISQDSQKFLMIKHGEPVGPYEVRVVLNWTEVLRTL